jgi:hypothetical protein
LEKKLVLSKNTIMKRKLFYGLVGVLLISCEFSVTTAKLTESKVCGTISSSAGCDEDVKVFTEIPDTIYAISKLSNAPKGTEIRYYWYQFLQGEYTLLDSLSYKNEHSSERIHSHIRTDLLPLGKYRVVTRIMADNRDEVVKDFELAIPEGIGMSMARVGNNVNEHGKVINQKANLDENDRMVYYSSFLYNLPANAMISVVFRDMSDGKVVKELNIQNGDEFEEAILLRANLNRDEIHLKPGLHQISIGVEGETFETNYIIL